MSNFLFKRLTEVVVIFVLVIVWAWALNIGFMRHSSQDHDLYSYKK